MTTIGDNLLFFGSLALIALTLWGTLLLANILFPTKVAIAAHAVERKPMKALGVGVAAALPVIGVILILANLPSPLIKIFALILLIGFILYSCLGVAGFARMVGGRVMELHPKASALSANGWGAALVILFGALPFIGWLVVAPVVLLMGFGLALGAQFGRISAPAPAGEVR